MADRVPGAVTDALLDWGLAVAALGVGILLMAGPSAPREAADLAAARELELSGKILDAQATMPPEVRAAIGLSPVDEANAPAQAVASAHETLQRRWPSAAAARLTVAAVAVALGERDRALEELDTVADMPAMAPPSADDPSPKPPPNQALYTLYDLAKARPVDPEALRGALQQLRASPWLIHRAQAQAAQDAGDSETAARQRAAAEVSAAAFTSRYTALGLTGLGLGIGGGLLLLAWPIVGRALRSRGLGIPLAAPSPFDPHRAPRVLSAWFIAYVLAAIGTSSAALSLGGGPHLATLAGAAQVLTHGGAAIFFIARWGRRPYDARPLAAPLRLTWGQIPGGGIGRLLGLAGWALGGLAVAVAVSVAAMFANAALAGEATAPQDALVALYQALDAPADLAVLVTTIVLLAPVFEELLFRGFLYRALRDLLTPGGAMVASALVFALIHLQPGNLLPLAALGFVLAWLYERSGTLWAPILVHATWNLGGVLYALLIARG